MFRMSLVGGLLLLACMTVGCEKALFVENQSRTPYDRYNALRGRQSAMTQSNPTGGNSPALRERLKPMGSQ